MPVAAELRALLGDAKVSTSESVLELHAGDLSYHPRRAPVAVVYPESTEEVSRVLRLRHGLGQRRQWLALALFRRFVGGRGGGDRFSRHDIADDKQCLPRDRALARGDIA